MNARAEFALTIPRPAAGGDWLAAAGLAGLAAVTRFPLLANAPGEADSARFLIGLEQWRRHGPAGHLIYGAVFSPGYYWLAAHWLAWFGVPVPRAAAALGALSAIAAVLSAPLIYFLGRRFLRRRAAAVAAALFLLTPGYWWLGLEAHPQQVSILLWLAAMALLAWAADGEQAARTPAAPTGRTPATIPQIAAQPLAFAAAGLAWAGALLIKSDAVLLAPAMVLMAVPAKKPEAEAANRRGGQAGRGLIAIIILAGGGGLFVLLRQMILGAAFGATQAEAGKTLGQFWSWPAPKAAVRQLAPVLFAAGPILWLWAVGGMVLAWAAWRARRAAGLPRLAAIAAAWVLPIYGFWWLIRGNNARHVALAFLPLLWLGAWGWEAWWDRRAGPHPDSTAAWRRHGRGNAGRADLLAALAVLVLLATNAEAVPPSSNITLFPSGDVPASAAMLRRKEATMRRWALGIAKHGGCYYGRYTPPYLIADILAADPAAKLARAGGATALSTTGAKAEFFPITTAGQIGAVRRACAGAVSLEYNHRGQHLRFLGGEWSGLPLAGRFYSRPAARP